MPFRVVIHTGYDYPEYHAVMEKARHTLTQYGMECVVIPMISDWSPEATIRCTEGFHAALASHEKWTAPVFEALRGTLQFICKLGTGMDTFDFEAAERCGVTIVNTPNANASAVADMTVALMLAVNRRVAQFDRLLRSGTWFTAHLGHQLEAATVGFIGYGAIARIVRRYLRGFDCRVLAWSRSAALGLDPGEDVEFVSLDTLAAESDYVSVHLPLTASTRGIVGEPFFAKMKSSALFFNTSRGPLVNQSALVAALQTGKIAGAGLDVFDPEPLAPGSPLLTMDSVVLTTHVAGNTLPAVQRVGELATQNVIDFVTQHRLIE